MFCEINAIGEGSDFAKQNHPQFHKKGSFRTAKALVIYMAKGGPKTIFVCNECGNVHNKWYGKCQACGAWDSLCEESIVVKPALGVTTSAVTNARAVKFSEIEKGESREIRYKTGIGEFDRAVGGGIVKGSVVLLSGEPGIGKSTILLQICKKVEAQKILYVSGEESAAQIKLRAERLGVCSDKIYILCANDISAISAEIDKISPDILIVDSIQTTYDSSLASSPGTVSQVKQVSFEIIKKTKECDMASILVGHVNKDGAIAGPKVLEHMVDVVLCFEGDRSQAHRIIRAAKNRYGSTNEIGVFEMSDSGLEEVLDPSKSFLTERPQNVSGCCTVCVLEGTRPILAEIQALVAKTVFAAPRRTSAGLSYNRMSILIAVLEKRLGIYMSSQDVYLNVVGGMQFDEPSSDLGIIMALISGCRDICVDDKLVAIGEVGLSGEVRSVGFIEARVKEAARLGFTTILVPYGSYKKIQSVPDGVNIIPVKSIYDLLKLFAKKD